MPTVYVSLLDEGIDVWRPANATQVGPMTYLLEPQSYDANHERWEFLPGTIVECQHKQLSGGMVLVAVRQAE